jgi:histidinol dehydrogenase
MKTYLYPPKIDWPSLLARPALETAQLESTVVAILDDIRSHGDEAVKKYTSRFDQVTLQELQVTANEIQLAETLLPASLKNAIRTAQRNIELFHSQQISPPEIVETMPGVRCWRKSVGIEKVGLYIPGGTAPLFSTVLMLGTPARLAGCKEIVLCSPPDRKGDIHPAILFAANLVGVTKIFKAGGVQAIGAMAYGTESIPQVYKIFGPGNQYVTAAKQQVSRAGIAIDMPAGPSEVLVCADESASPAFVAADLLSQAEHGADSQVVLVAFTENFVAQVQQELEKQVVQLPREQIARQALDNSMAIVVASHDEAVDLINVYAPEHLILSVQSVENMAELIVNAGSVFMGNFTPESVGDYASGPNHTLPTNGYARAYSGVSLDSFVKKITFQQVSQAGLEILGPVVEEMALAEALTAHQLAVRIRLDAAPKNTAL